ncbi:MAG: hypothetical protein ACREIM_03655 [Nitrospiraceae bacterium]
MIVSTTCIMALASSFLLLVILFPVTGSAGTPDTRPFWTEQAVFHFGDDVFFTGRASCAPNSEEGRQRAYGSALQEIKNFAHVNEVVGFPIDTQMIFEESRSSDCAPDSVTVWRLLRASRAALESLARRPGIDLRRDISPIDIQTRVIRNLTPRVGMLRDEIWHRYGQPRSVWMNPESGEARWEYPQFGMILTLDQDDILTHWKLSGPHSRSEELSVARMQENKMTPAQELPAIDLTDRLRELEERQDREYRQQAERYCTVRFPNPLQESMMQQRLNCAQREYERFKYTRQTN